MSRLPRKLSPPLPLPHTGPTMASSSNLKRKATEDELEATDQPRKLPKIGVPGGALRPSRAVTSNISSALSNSRLALPLPPPLTRPRAPSSATSTTQPRTRATSAPPKSVAPPPRAGPSRPTAAAPRPRVPSGSTVRPNIVNGKDDKRFADLQTQMESIETARAADSARLAEQMEAERAKVAQLQFNHSAMNAQLAAARTQELSQRKELDNAFDELQKLKRIHERELGDMETELRKKDREIRSMADDKRLLDEDLERERTTVTSLKSTIAAQSNAQITLSTQVSVLQTQLSALQTTLDSANGHGSSLGLQLEVALANVQRMEGEAREGEATRRRLHNQVQELKGNIRVFCRVRPVLSSDNGDAQEAEIEFPDKMDHKEIVLSTTTESATGEERKGVYQFGFDRVFESASTQADIFEEISLLAQSCTDGYNVCIFAYGQTGSGKSFTMEGGSTDATMGMIPRAVAQVFQVAEDLKSKGWEYTITGQFLEIYNETLNDLLGSSDFDKKKHDIRHDAKTGATTVTDAKVVPLASPAAVKSLLALAASRRSVAATLMNERSSRSHSVFTLRITGVNHKSGEELTGTLNLVDLAGSERLASSGAQSEVTRLKETQAINKSLSALGDVIAALGEKGEKGDKHVPYRNSKLTYLLQNSLSGNSKTLMVLNLSPLAAHMQESLTSLRFATKVNNTAIGTAKKQTKTGA